MTSGSGQAAGKDTPAARLVQLTSFQHLISAQTYNALFTLHGVIMIFLFVIPGIPAVFGNFFLPILIGAKDVSFPRLNLASWYFYMAGAILAVLSLFTGGGAPDTGWTVADDFHGLKNTPGGLPTLNLRGAPPRTSR